MATSTPVQAPGAGLADHPRMCELVRRAAAPGPLPALGLVYPCDGLSLASARDIVAAGLARPVLVGPPDLVAAVADDEGIDLDGIELVAVGGSDPRESAKAAVALARSGELSVLMKGSLHTDELLGPVVARGVGLRTERRLSHVFLFDIPAYPKLLALSDCVVNIAPDLAAKREVLTNAVAVLRRLGIEHPNVAVVAAVETVNESITATVDARALAELAASGCWPGVTVEGPLGFDNAVSAQAALAKRIDSRVAGEVDLLIVPDLNAGNLLYKSLTYFAGSACAGIVVGATVPVVLTSRADDPATRLASAALGVLNR
jgi:phosphate acetyltransferase